MITWGRGEPAERRDERWGWAASIVLHALLALGFLRLAVEVKPFDLEFTVISFSAAADAETGAAGLVADYRAAQPQIELPRRLMLEESSPLLRLPESPRRAEPAVEPIEKPKLAATEPVTPRRFFDLSPTAGLKTRPDLRPMPLAEEFSVSTRPDLVGEQIQGDEAFSISWEGTPRRKVSGELPEFPPGVNVAATVKIAFEVNPDGTVAFTAPLTKGHPELERVSMQALRNWRFNALDASSPPVKQKGEATFIFKLK